MPSGRERFKRSFEGRALIESVLKFAGHFEFRGLFVWHFEPGLLHLNGLVDIGFQNGFQLNYFLNIGEPNLAGRLHVLSLLDQNTAGILQQDALKKQKRAVVFESMKQDDVASLKRVTRATPPQFFGQPTAENDRPQLLKFFLALFGFSEKEINFGICSALCHSIEAIWFVERFLAGLGSCK